MPFSQNRISNLKKEIHDLISEELEYILDECYIDTTEHVFLQYGYLSDRKKREIMEMRDGYMNPIVLFSTVDAILQKAFGESLIAIKDFERNQE